MDKSPCPFYEVMVMSYMRSLCLVMSQTYSSYSEFTYMSGDLSRFVRKIHQTHGGLV